MTRLFVLMYLGVLAVLFAAWLIHGVIMDERTRAERASVFEQAHGGGARLVAGELDAVADSERDAALEQLREQFDYPISMAKVSSLPENVRRRIESGDDIAYLTIDDREEMVVALLEDGQHVVRLGPFSDYFGVRGIERRIGGWMRLVAEKVEGTTSRERQSVLGEIQERFEVPLALAELRDLPPEPRRRLGAESDVVFYVTGEPESRAYAAAPLADEELVVLCGPFPRTENEQERARSVAATTLAFVLLPVALAIALLLRPIVLQLRHVESAAKAIAGGDLSARVDAKKARSVESLARAFNEMAGRTETLVRTQRELLQAVSHELRTPLSRLRFGIELVEAAETDAQRRDRLVELDEATSELDDLVGELLRYVRMETAEPVFQPEPVAIHDVLEAINHKYEALFPSVQFDIAESDAADDIYVMADCQGLERALGNLVSNAARFAETQVAVHVGAAGSTVTIDVDDDGCGIAESDRQRVFEPFVRLDQTSPGQGRGVGLGLALVRRIVTQHGGQVEVMTSPAGGCRVRTTWQMADVPAAVTS